MNINDEVKEKNEKKNRETRTKMSIEQNSKITVCIFMNSSKRLLNKK